MAYNFIFFLAGLYLIGKLRLRHEMPVEEIGVGRLMASVAFFGAALYLLSDLGSGVTGEVQHGVVDGHASV